MKMPEIKQILGPLILSLMFTCFNPQAMPTTFNRGMLMNIGFIEANTLGDFDCVIFHDVDLYPEDDRHLYKCPENPTHMSAAVDKFNYR